MKLNKKTVDKIIKEQADKAERLSQAVNLVKELEGALGELTGKAMFDAGDRSEITMAFGRLRTKLKELGLFVAGNF